MELRPPLHWLLSSDRPPGHSLIVLQGIFWSSSRASFTATRGVRTKRLPLCHALRVLLHKHCFAAGACLSLSLRTIAWTGSDTRSIAATRKRRCSGQTDLHRMLHPDRKWVSHLLSVHRHVKVPNISISVSYPNIWVLSVFLKSWSWVKIKAGDTFLWEFKFQRLYHPFGSRARQRNGGGGYGGVRRCSIVTSVSRCVAAGREPARLALCAATHARRAGPEPPARAAHTAPDAAAARPARSALRPLPHILPQRCFRHVWG